MGCLREREQLIQCLEQEREARHQKREQEKHYVATPLQEVRLKQNHIFGETTLCNSYSSQEQHCGLRVDCRLGSAKNRWRRKRRMTRSQMRKSWRWKCQEMATRRRWDKSPVRQKASHVFELHVSSRPLVHTSSIPSRFPAELDLPGLEKAARPTPNQNFQHPHNSSVEVIR